jgi:hypothetical protein
MNMTESVSQDPRRGLMRHPFLPIQPSPARAAQTFSMATPVSTQA